MSILDAALVAEDSRCRHRVGACSDFHGWDAVCNIDKTHPALPRYGYPEYSNIHAELRLALQASAAGLSRRTVYVARLARNGDWAMARPCQFCMKVLVSCGVRRVVYTTGPEKTATIRL